MDVATFSDSTKPASRRTAKCAESVGLAAASNKQRDPEGVDHQRAKSPVQGLVPIKALNEYVLKAAPSHSP
jgi:hypothetical protein